MDVVWAIWKHRNTIVFEEANYDGDIVVDGFKYFFVELVQFKYTGFNYSLHEGVDPTQYLR